jgi:type IV pilus assembly protein PilA
MKDTRLQQGFTLIEVAIVVAVMTVLALIAYPVYSNYVKSAKVLEGLTLAATAKIAVNHCATNNVPLTSVWTPPALTKTVMDMEVHVTETTGIRTSSHGELLTNLPARYSGEIIITFSPDIAPVAHNELVLSPRQADPNLPTSNGHELPLGYIHTATAQSITWECNSANPPSINRGSHGNLDAKLAPADCRA